VADVGRPGLWDEEVLASFEKKGDGLMGKVFSYFFYEGRVKVAGHVKLMFPFLMIKGNEGRVKVACHVVEPLTHLLDLCKWCG
jgi:hypothetical protein